MTTFAHIEAHLTSGRAEGLAVRTLQSRGELLRRLAAVWAGVDVTTELVESWLCSNPNWAAETRAAYFGHLHAYLSWCHRRGLIPADPTADMRRPKVQRGLPKPVTAEVLADILARVDDRWRLIVTLGAYAGLRMSEIAGLRRDDVTRERIRVRGKGSKVRTVPTHPRVWELVEPIGAGYVVLSRTGAPFTGDTMSVTARWLFDRLGYPDVHLHRFRHTFGTNIYRATRDLGVTARVLGHASVATTQVYALVDESACAAAVAGLQ